MPRKSSPPAPKTISALIIPDLERSRLDKALVTLLADQVETLSRARLQALIADGQLTLGGKVVEDSSRKVKAGEVYKLTLPPPEPATPEAQKISLTVVYEDKDLLVIDKPAGMVVHPAPGNRDKTLVNALLAHCGKSLSGIGGVARPGIVHRLDKDTSGLIVVAKNDLAHQELTKQFADRSLSRTYQAVVWGEPVPRTGEIYAPIGRHSRDRVKMAVISKGKEALTYYKVLKAAGQASLVECKLATGRTHQIRVHLAHIKHPVVGDPVYGGRRVPLKGSDAEILKSFPRQALHAAELEFLHPRSEKHMSFRSKLPKDMAALLKALGIKNAN
ncbi:MAG TPA: RluA family pseudouridine synthase [Alphaproteobacteria bacterium]|nr:RluA family pseudouridine synthase [Alphaproteobacteria bacterium]